MLLAAAIMEQEGDVLAREIMEQEGNVLAREIVEQQLEIGWPGLDQEVAAIRQEVGCPMSARSK